ncbi:hypothetical protein O999_18790 [Pseudomonas putida LF54]|nr:hypothetical protein O999_18790 [Pseudomonas putida LF54]
MNLQDYRISWQKSSQYQVIQARQLDGTVERPALQNRGL